MKVRNCPAAVSRYESHDDTEAMMLWEVRRVGLSLQSPKTCRGTFARASEGRRGDNVLFFALREGMGCFFATLLRPRRFIHGRFRRYQRTDDTC